MGAKPSLNYNQILELKAQGLGYGRIAKAVGCTKGTVYVILKKLKNESRREN